MRHLVTRASADWFCAEPAGDPMRLCPYHALACAYLRPGELWFSAFSTRAPSCSCKAAADVWLSNIPKLTLPLAALAAGAMTAKTGVPFTREEFLSVCDEFKGTVSAFEHQRIPSSDSQGRVRRRSGTGKKSLRAGGRQRCVVLCTYRSGFRAARKAFTV